MYNLEKQLHQEEYFFASIHLMIIVAYEFT